MASTESLNNTEKDILEAAKKVFVEKGYSGARMQAIADEANINKAMLHYYFRSKDALFDRIVDGAVEIMAREFTPVLSSEGSVMEKVEMLIDGYTKTIIENPYIPIFVLNELSQNADKYQARLKSKMEKTQFFSGFLFQIAEEQQKGILKPVGVDQFIITVMSLLVFPFVARPVFENMLGLEKGQYFEMMENRKALIKEIIHSSLVEKKNI